MQDLLREVIQKAAPEADEKRVKRQGFVNAGTDLIKVGSLGSMKQLC